jgi:hypothetical protein
MNPDVPVMNARRMFNALVTNAKGVNQQAKQGKPPKTKGAPEGTPFCIGAGDEIRTHDPNLGKVMLYP